MYLLYLPSNSEEYQIKNPKLQKKWCNNRLNQFNKFKPVFPSKSEEYQIENPKLQNMMQ